MMIYLLILLLALGGWVLYDIRRPAAKERKAYYIFLYGVLILVVGFRYKLGGDTFMYMDMWEDLPTLSELFTYGFSDVVYGYQPLWYVFNGICKLFSNDFVFFQLVHALVVNSVFAWFIWRYSRVPFFTTFIYICFFFLYYNTEVLRAFLAVSMLLLGTPALEQKKWIKFYFWCAMAIGFHISALLLIIFPLLHILKKWDWKWIFVFVGFGMVTFLFRSTVVDTLLTYTSAWESLHNKIYSYGDVQLEDIGYTPYSLWGWIAFFLTCAVPCYLLYKTNNAQVYSIFRGMAFVLAFVVAAQNIFGNFIIRLTDFMYPYYIILISRVYADVRAQTHGIRLAIPKLVFCLVFFIFSFDRISYRYLRPLSTYGYYYQLWVPYSSIFNEDSSQEREHILYLYRQ